MPFRATALQIGSNTFYVPNIKGAHQVEDQKLGPSGPVEFTFTNPTAEGLLSIEEGIKFRPNKYLSAKGGDAAFPGQVLIQPQATTVSVGSGQQALMTPIKQLDFTSGGTTRAYLVGSGNTIYRTNTDTPPVWQSVGSLPESAKDIALYGNGVAVAHGFGYRYSTDGATWSVASQPARALGVLGGNLYRGASPNQVFAGTGGSLGTAWDSGTTVGDNSFLLNSIAGLEQILMVGREDGIYSYDADGTVVQFTPELRGIASSVLASAARACSFNGDYYFATQYGLIQISGADGAKRRIGLDQLASPDLPTPQVRAVCSDDRYLYVLCQNSSNDLMILRRGIYGAWNTLFWDASSGVKAGQHLAVSSALGYPALFYSQQEGYKFTETFGNTTQWTSISGAIGSVSGNILTAGATTLWWVRAAGASLNDGRISAQGKLTEDVIGAMWVNKHADSSNYVSAVLSGGATDRFDIRKTVGGSQTTVASMGFAPSANQWYWIDLECQGSNYRAKLYQATASAASRGTTAVVAELAAIVADAGVVSGQLALRSDNSSTAAQWGGISTSPGGTFVEGLPVTRAIRLSTFPNPLQDSNYRYDTGTQNFWLRLGRFGPSESNIVLDRVTVLSDSLGASIHIVPFLSNEGAAAAQFGASAAFMSPYQEIRPASAVEGRYFDAYAYFRTADSATSPVLREISFKGWLQPGLRRLHKWLVIATGSFQTPEGDYTIDDPVTTINNLETLRTTDGYVSVVDEYGQSWSGYVADVNRTLVDVGGTDKTAVQAINLTIVEKS